MGEKFFEGILGKILSIFAIYSDLHILILIATMCTALAIIMRLTLIHIVFTDLIVFTDPLDSGAD